MRYTDADMPHRLDFTEIFVVLVGQPPEQQRFTVYKDAITARSRSFAAARSTDWTSTGESSKPTELVDDDPKIFAVGSNVSTPIPRS
jgi:hypothetical protein